MKTNKADLVIEQLVHCDLTTEMGIDKAKQLIKSVLIEQDAKITVLKNALAGLIGVEKKEELDTMEIIIRMSPQPESDKAVAINAIDALRLCL